MIAEDSRLFDNRLVDPDADAIAGKRMQDGQYAEGEESKMGAAPTK